MSELEFRTVPEGEFALYEGLQDGAHPVAALHLDLNTGVVSFLTVYSEDDALTLPEDMEDNEFLQWPVEPFLKRDVLVGLYEDAKPLIERAFDGFEWKGHRATLTDAGRTAYDALGRMFANKGDNPAFVWSIWDAKTFFTASGSIEDAVKDVIRAETSDAEIAAVIENLVAEAQGKSIWLSNTDLLTIDLTELRDGLRVNMAA